MYHLFLNSFDIMEHVNGTFCCRSFHGLYLFFRIAISIFSIEEICDKFVIHFKSAKNVVKKIFLELFFLLVCVSV